MNYLEQILAQGNLDRGKRTLPNVITCADGFKLSVVAGDFVYSSPRRGEAGPYTEVEVGFPSERPEPWDDLWREYAENRDNPTGTVYGYVPAAMVRDLVASHGGER